MRTILFCFLLVMLIASQVWAAPNDDLILIRGGAFNMGSPESEAWRSVDETEHKVIISDFYIAPCEVTQAEYSAVMGNNPSSFNGSELPVENVTWFDAVKFCNALSLQKALTPVYTISGNKVTWDRSADGYRLPTEAEWEYSCRAGTTTPFNTENSIDPDECNYYGHYPYMIEENYFSQGKLETKPGVYRQTTVDVKSFAPNKWGLYNMHGNICEWCWDVYAPYDSSEQKANENPTGSENGIVHVIRGGGWNDFAKHLRSAYRASSPATQSSATVGFRIARNAAALSGVVSCSGENETAGKGQMLIIFYSWSGNTRGIAREIQKQTGAEIFEIVPEPDYSDDYNKVLREAQRDQRRRARPKIKGQIKDIEKYDIIFLGYPNWWASIPMPIATLLETYDFSGKTIVPFCSNGGGRFGQSLSVIAKLAPKAKLAQGLSVSYSGGGRLSETVSAWLKKNQIKN